MDHGQEHRTDPDRFTLHELIGEVRREVRMRRSVYPKWVRAGRMERVEADRQIDLMVAVERRLTKTAGM
ncbi:hypothetical protein [Pseudogemmobacter sp. W21_MBD1_M6]|uniref:hypothetical protein n=1 Tax=Pseudogemmobacter sp. W21_MBD1_M6 TaxID=3240271 RepID=UPI003F99BE5A